jgi:hypothetical protein
MNKKFMNCELYLIDAGWVGEPAFEIFRFLGGKIILTNHMIVFYNIEQLFHIIEQEIKYANTG